MLLLGATAASARVEPSSWDAVVAAYARVQDYTCMYDKEERAISNGEPQRIKLSFRKPLDVRMEWLDGGGKVDQIAVYRQGFNDGKLIARRSGMVGSMLGTMHLDPTEKRALMDSRHPITEVGFGPLIDGIARGITDGVFTPVAVAGAAGPQFTWDVRGSEGALGIMGAKRIVVRVDPRLLLPLEVDVFDAKGARLEHHLFSDIRTNVGLSDAVFTL